MDINLSYNSPYDPIHISHRIRDTKNAMHQYHSHDEHYEIYYLIEGKRKYFIKDKTYYIDSGNLVFINKGELHRTFHIDDYKHERFLVNFTTDYLNAEEESYNHLLQSIFNKTFIIQPNLYEKQEFENIIYTMKKEIKKKEEGYKFYLKTLLVQLLIFTARHLNENSASTQETSGDIYHKMTDVIRYINQNYNSEDLSLEATADKFFISSYYLSRIFKEATGFTYIEYLNHVRIQKAQRMLKESDTKIIDIAGKVGFNSLTHFGRVFKGFTQFTPSAYRKIHKV